MKYRNSMIGVLIIVLDQCNDGIGRKYRNYTEFFSFNQCS